MLSSWTAAVIGLFKAYASLQCGLIWVQRDLVKIKDLRKKHITANLGEQLRKEQVAAAAAASRLFEREASLSYRKVG